MLEFLVALIVVLGGALASFYAYSKKKYAFWAKRGFPHTTPIFPWGDAQGFATKRSMSQIAGDVYKSFPKERLVGFHLLWRPNLLIRDPELIRLVLIKDFEYFHDRGVHVNEERDPLAGHLVTLSGKKWKNLRVKLTPTFSSGKIKMMFPIMVECSQQLVKVLEKPASKGEVIEVKDYVSRFTTDIISLAAFGVRTDSLNHPNAEFWLKGQQVYDLSMVEAIKHMIHVLIPALEPWLDLRLLRKDLSDYFLRVFKENIDYREENNISRNDFMDLLIQLKNRGRLDDALGKQEATGYKGFSFVIETKMSFETAAAQAYVFFVAGYETSATTMQFATYEMARNPDIQERARSEVTRVLEKYGGEFTYEAAMEMEYLSRVIDETLRKYPSAPMTARQCTKDWKVPDSDLIVPKGAAIVIDLTGLHNDERYYPNPDKFDPERFTEEGKASRPNYTYIPFGEGPRICIGQRFGLLQTRVGLANLLFHYKFSVAKETPIPVVYDPRRFFLTPKGGMYIKINKI